MAASSSIYDRLTDPSKYTGTHKNRFDSDGKGKGIEGRVDRVDMDGYVDGFKKTQTEESKKKTLSKKDASVVDRLTDPKLYTGSHKSRFDEEGKGKGIDGRVDRVAADGYVDGFKKAKEKERIASASPKKTTAPTKSSPAIFDKLTDPKLYTGSHKSRFDEEGKGKGINQTIDKDQIKDLSDITRTDMRSRAKSSPAKPATSSPAASPATKAPSTKATSSTKTSSATKASSPAKKPATKKADVFDKLTDPKLYTGAHKQRFDESGRGRGASGRRDDVELKGYVNGYKHENTYEG